jgi:hypothetical protein
MIPEGKRVFYVGIVVTLICAWLRARGWNAWPWLWLFTGGFGLICGAIYVYPADLKVIFLSLIGLVIALSAILLQDYNPKWLSDIVFWVRVFFAHVLLSFALLHLIKPRRDPPEDA